MTGRRGDQRPLRDLEQDGIRRVFQTEFLQCHPSYLFVEVPLTIPQAPGRAFPTGKRRLVVLVDGPDPADRLRMCAFAPQMCL